MKIVAKFELLLIALWLGAACFFSFGVAPSAFSVLPTSELAGNVVNRVLFIVNVSGLVISALLLATSFLPRDSASAFWTWGRRILLIIIAVACAGGQFVIGTWLALIRGQFGKPVDEIAADDPLKLQFDQLHQASVWVLVTAMIAALLAFFVMSRESKAKEQPSAEPDFDFSNEFKV